MTAPEAGLPKDGRIRRPNRSQNKFPVQVLAKISVHAHLCSKIGINLFCNLNHLGGGLGGTQKLRHAAHQF